MVIRLAAFQLCVLFCVLPVSRCETLQGDAGKLKTAIVDGSGAAENRLLRREVVKIDAEGNTAHEGDTIGTADTARANSDLRVRQQEIVKSIESAVSTGSIAAKYGGAMDVDVDSGTMSATAMSSKHVAEVDRKMGIASLVEGDSFSDIASQRRGIANRSRSWMTVNGSTLTIEPKKITLFCFAWTARRPGYEEDSLDEIRKQFSACDGNAIFTDEDAKGPDLGFIKVSVPKQTKTWFPQRHFDVPQLERENKWLWHRNMAGIMQAWKYLLEQNIAEKYDWILNTEFDHMVRPAQVRYTIGNYMQTLWSGSPDERLRVGKAMMLMWGNAFVFSKDAVREMKRQWPTLGKTMGEDSKGSGCPDWMEGHSFWPNECAQDIVYPTMAMVMQPPLAAYGAPGCGQRPRNAIGEAYLLPCYQMDVNPFGMSEKGQQDTIRAIAANHTKQMVLLEENEDTGPALPVTFDRGTGGGEETEAEVYSIEETEAEGEQEHATKYATKVQDMLENTFALIKSTDGMQRMRFEVLMKHLDRYRRSLARQREEQKTAKQSFLPDFHTPIYHQVYFLSVHKLGRELLSL